MAVHAILSQTPRLPIATTITACLSPINDMLRECTSSFVFFSRNQFLLGNSLRSLESLAEKLKGNVEEEEAQLQICNPDVKEWLKKVEEIVNHVKPLLVNDNQNDGDSQHCCNFTKFRRFRIGRKVSRALEDVTSLLIEGRLFTPPFTSPYLSEAVQFQSTQIPTVGIDVIMHLIWSQFNDEHISVVGLYGLAGVGKTTVLKRFNNELRERNKEFKMVIYVEVANAKMLNVVGIQIRISDRLGLPWNEAESDVNRAAFLHNVLSKKKFVVMLDDVWNKFKLEDVGIPTLHPEGKGIKLIVASRRDSVCADMGAKRPIEMHCLQKDEAWELFLSKLMENVRAKVLADDEMKKCAVEIVESCGGLPLAIDAISSTLRVCDTLGAWYYVLTEIKQNPSSIDDIDQMLTILKYSYDMLKETEKKCFLYCTMFPDYSSICHEQLVDYWAAEALISSELYEGYFIITKLISACLLQRSDSEPTSEVKIHQMIRKMGHQQMSTGNKFMIKAGQALKEAPDAIEWEEATRISLMFNEISVLSISPNCSKLLTLLLQNNPTLHQLCPKFFDLMPALRVLDLSHTAISMLPDCSSLVKLVYLNLSHTPIKEVPKQLCSTLLELQHLNMSHTFITELPQQLAKLEKLMYLNLEETSDLKVIPQGTISKLFKLKVLNLYKSNGVKDLFDLNLEGLGHLTYLGISIFSQQNFHKIIETNLLVRCTRFLSLSHCVGMKSIQLSEFKMMSHLMELHIESCDDLEELIYDCNDGIDSSLKRLKVLTLVNLPNLVKLFDGFAIDQFEDLHRLTIHKCSKLEDASWVLRLKSLERLVITECHSLKRLVPEELEAEPPGYLNEAAWNYNCDILEQEPPARGAYLDEVDWNYNCGIIEQAPSIGNLDEAAWNYNCDILEHAPPAVYLDEVVVEYNYGPSIEAKSTGYLDESAHMITSLKQSIPASTRLGEGWTRRFPYLESITVEKCLNLTQLPDSQMCPNLKLIYGEGSWWETIAPEVKANLSDLFIPF